MTSHPLSQTAGPLPKLAWLKLTGFALNVAVALFAVSRRLHWSLPQWLLVSILRVAAHALEHAPADSFLEFRADLPVQI